MASFKKLSQLWTIFCSSESREVIEFNPLTDATRELQDKYNALSPILKAAVEDLGMRLIMSHSHMIDSGEVKSSMQEFILTSRWYTRVIIYWLGTGMFIDLSVSVKDEIGVAAFYTGDTVTDLFTYLEEDYTPLMNCGVELFGIKKFIDLYTFSS